LLHVNKGCVKTPAPRFAVWAARDVGKMPTAHISCRPDNESYKNRVQQQLIRVGELGIRDVLKHERPAHSRNGTDWFTAVNSLLGPHEDLASSMKGFTSVDDQLQTRAIDAVMDIYRRVAGAERAPRLWSSDRWGLVAQLLAKLRALASLSYWDLPSPAFHLSRDPKALGETGMEDPVVAAAAIETQEGIVEARLLRICARLQLDVTTTTHRARGQRRTQFTPEVETFARLCLTHFRFVGEVLQRLVEAEDPRSVLMPSLAEAYGALIAAITCLRQRLGGEVRAKLQMSQDTLEVAASSASSLGLMPQSKVSSRVMASLICAKDDPFRVLHQGTLLTSIASLAEIAEMQRVAKKPKQLGDTVHEAFDVDEMTNWNVEFTEAQLLFMRSAVQKSEPKVEGVQELLQETLFCYKKVGEAMSGSYSEERTLRASPPELSQHTELLSLAGCLRQVWRDSGAVMVDRRQADLLALEKVRLRHKALVSRAFKDGGEEVAVILLARLAIVDEMFELPEDRRLIGELPSELQRIFNITETLTKGLAEGESYHQLRRRRWTYCPHGTVYCVAGGAVCQQLLGTFNSVEASFDGLGDCVKHPLTIREFRLACCFLELSVTERVAVLMHEAAAEMSKGQEATLSGLLKMALQYGFKGLGEFGAGRLAAAAAAKAVSRQMQQPAEKAAPRPQRNSSTAGAQAEADDAAADPKAVANSAPLIPPSVVCTRCLRGDMPSFPYVSVGEMSRRFAVSAHGASSDPASPTGGEPGKRGSIAGKSEANDPPSKPGANKAADDDKSQFNEDAVVAWATSVLASQIMLKKDERGAYFRWLARIILYSRSEDARNSDIARAPVQKESQSGGAVGGKFGRRKSVQTSPLSAVEEKKEPEKELPANDDDDPDADDDKEALRQQTLVLSEGALSSMRVDLGLPAVPTVFTNESDGAEAVRKKLYSGFGDRVSKVSTKSGTSIAQKMKLQARHSRMIVGLRRLKVEEPEIERMHKELQVAAELPSTASGLILIGGAPGVAMEIIFNGSPPLLVSEAVTALKSKSSPSKDKANAAKASQANKGVAAQEVATNVLQNSRADAAQCYGRAGYSSDSSVVAVALRLLEQELYPDGVCSIGGAIERPDAPARGRSSSRPTIAYEPEELTTDLAPFLLAKKAAAKNLAQVRRGQDNAAAEAVATAETSASTAKDPQKIAIPRRGSGSNLVVAGAKEWLSGRAERMAAGIVVEVPILSSPIGGSDSSSVDRQQLQDTVASPKSALSGGSGTPKSSESKRVRTPSSDRKGTPTSKSRQRNSSESLDHVAERPRLGEVPPFSIPEKSLCKGVAIMLEGDGTLADALLKRLGMQERRTDLSEWPMPVKRLLNSVSTRGDKMRITTGGQGFHGGNRKGLSRSVGALPALTGMDFQMAASECRRPRLAGAYDSFVNEGWRAKVATNDTGLLGQSLSSALSRRGR